MTSRSQRWLVLLMLPLVHVFLCVAAQLDLLVPGKEHWIWVIVYIVDYPITLLANRANLGDLALAGLGTLFWFIVGLCLYGLLCAISRGLSKLVGG